MSSGSPMRFKGGMLRSSVVIFLYHGMQSCKGGVTSERQPNRQRVCRLLTMYMHPAIANLQCAGHLYVVDSLRESLGYRLMKDRQEKGYVSPQRSRRSAARTSEMKQGRGSAQFCTKSLRPASRSSAGVSAGSQPRTVLDLEDGGASARRDTAKTGRVADRGVGGETRW